MYMRITSKCNMRCAHCCYSCRPGKGEHAPLSRVMDMINFASQYTEHISIGGGEPTMHPDFFQILRMCLYTFDHTWMATNGSKVRTMRRLLDILNEEDYREDAIIAEDKLAVALSTDYYHAYEMVDPYIRASWEKAARARRRGFEVRDVTQSNSGVANTGRAAKTGVGLSDHCVCNSIIIDVDGSLKACGCENAPIIGDIWSGFTEKWERIMRASTFNDYGCYNEWRKDSKR